MNVSQVDSMKFALAHGNMAVYRIHWLKAKCRRDCWQEELILLQSEMNWTEHFFRHRASRWKALAAESSAIASSNIDANSESDHPPMPSECDLWHSQGHICYALKLESMWN